MESIVKAMLSKGYGGKISDVSEHSLKYRTSISRFLSRNGQNSWNEKYLAEALKKLAVELIWKRSKESDEAICFIIDDTISEKTKPSSKAVNVIQSFSTHHSHLKKNFVYGHQIVVGLLSCNGLVLPYSIEVYEKENMSKIDIAKKIIQSLPKPVKKGFVLCESWYSCKALLNASKKAGYTHTYTGKLNDMKEVSIVLSYPKNSLQEDGSLRAFISLETSLTALEILNLYTLR